MSSELNRNVPCWMSETSTPSLLSFATAVMATGPYLTLSNLRSFFWRTRSPPCGRIHSFPPASVRTCNIGTFEVVVTEARETCLKSKPSKRSRPLSVPIQRYPSVVCAMPLITPPGNPVSVVHCSWTYRDGARLGWSARASVTRPASTIPIRIHWACFTRKSREVLEFVDDDLILVLQRDVTLMKYIQGNAHRFAPWSRHTVSKHVLIRDTTGTSIPQSRYRRKRYSPWFPPKRMCVETRRFPKGKIVSWNVVRLDDIIYVGIVKVSPTTNFDVQLAPVALRPNAIPGD